MWRYREALPIDSDVHILSLDEGFTPLTPLAIGDKRVLFKLDHLFPTGSFKDRGASVLMSKAHELGVNKVVEDSSGNAGCAIAAYAAAGGIGCEIFAPEKTSSAKLTQIRAYGANLHPVAGSREDTAKAALLAANDAYYASHVCNPFFLHGTKTFAFEVCEQLGWEAPDTLVLPAGNGTLLLGAYIGFSELLKCGLIDYMPKMVAVQTESCRPLHAAWEEKSSEPCAVTRKLRPTSQAIYESDESETFAAIKKDTFAEGMAIAKPMRGRQMLEAVKKCRGKFISVSEDEIRSALSLSFGRGFYIEPTAAATVAGVCKYLSDGAKPDEMVVSAFTGHGLKDTEKILSLLENR